MLFFINGKYCIFLKKCFCFFIFWWFFLLFVGKLRNIFLKKLCYFVILYFRIDCEYNKFIINFYFKCVVINIVVCLKWLLEGSYWFFCWLIMDCVNVDVKLCIFRLWYEYIVMVLFFIKNSLNRFELNNKLM